MVKEISGYAYPWDVIGDPAFAGRARDLGLETITLAAAYHEVRAATPMHPRHQLVHARHAALYRPIRHHVWRGRRLVPQRATWLDEADSFGVASRRLRREGFRVVAWIVLAHNSRLGETIPQVSVVNCFGERYPYALCPAHEEVREYAATLAAEAVASVKVDGVSLEACGQLGVAHRGHHEKTEDAWTPAARRALSVCCCVSCRRQWHRQGLDPRQVVARLRQVVREEAAGTGRRGAAGAEPEIWHTPVFGQVLAARHDAADLLRSAVIEAIRAETPDAAIGVHAHPDPWETGGSVGLTSATTADADAIVVPAWATGPSGAEIIARAAAAAGGSAPIDAYLSILPPADPDAVPDHARRVVAAGADRLSLYHLGLAPAWRQPVAATVVAAHRTGPR